MRALLVYPIHENCDEVVTEATSMGLDAVAYPGRSTNVEKGENCWNFDADEAEQIGFPVVKTVCPTCTERARCGISGYLKQLGDVQYATIAACTHKRAECSGLREMCLNRGYVSIHENAISILRPKCECSSSDLFQVQNLFKDLLENPKSLDWFGDDLKVDDNGVRFHDEELAVRKERLYEFCKYTANIVEDLIRCLDAAEKITEWVIPSGHTRPQGIERLLFGVSRRMKLRFEDQPWRFILAASSGDLKSAAVVVYRPFVKGGKKAEQPTKRLLGFRQNSPHESCTTWFNDATISADALSAVLNQPVQDKTPQGRIELQKKAVQIVRDITRQTSSKKVQSLLRGILSDRPQFERVGVIGHSTHMKAIANLEPEFSRRIVRKNYFGSGTERSSNAWHKECDLIIIAGTPRVPPSTITEYLIQIGRVGAAARDVVWGPIRWIGTTETGNAITVSGRGYHDEDWRRAYIDQVRATLIQSIGRGRGILESGCEVLVLSNEECGIPISDSEQQPLNETHVAVLDKLVYLSAVSPINRYIGKTAVSSKDLSTALEMSNRQVRDILKGLDERGLAIRVGDRGGWLPVNEEAPASTPPDPNSPERSQA